VVYRSVLSRAHGPLGIRLGDVGMTLVVLLAVELSVATGSGPGAAPLNTLAYVLGAILVLPVLVRNRFPRFELIACSVLLLLYYWFDRRDISPAPLLCVPLYDAAAAGFLVPAIVIPAVYMTIGLFVVDIATRQGIIALAQSFLPSIVLLALAIMLGEVVRSRRALAAETAERLRVANEEREAEAARRVAEERLRIARDLHDTVAHSMATITVQAGSALHVLGPGDEKLRGALLAIRETSRDVLREMRATLGQLRQGPGDGDGPARMGGMDRLPALRDAVTAAGAPVTIAVEGEQRPLPPPVDEVAYRILQESLTNVLRHAGPAATATVRLCYEPAALGIQVTDDGTGAPAGANGGHGLTGMAERAAAVGGTVTAGPRGEGGFEVSARLPLPTAAGSEGAAAPEGAAGPGAAGVAGGAGGAGRAGGAG
jgi:signal transduction histidine kinase